MPNTALARRRLITPRMIAGNIMWLRSSRGLFQSSAGTTPALAEGDPIGYATDYSGKGNHPTQVTAGARPFLHFDEFGLPVIRTVGSNFLILPSSHVVNRIAYSIFFISRYRGDSQQRVYSKIGATQSLYQLINNRWAYFNGTSTPQSTLGPIIGPALHGLTCGPSGVTLIYQDEATPVQVLNNGTSTTLTGGHLFDFNSGFYAEADFCDVMSYNRVVPPAEYSQLLRNYARIVYPYYRTYTKQVVCDGDSMTGGTMSLAIDAPWPNVMKLSLGLAWLVRNLSTLSVTVAQMNADAATRVDQFVNARYSRNVCVLMGGTNDLWFGANAATTYSNITTYCAARRAAGWKVVVLTILPRTQVGVPGTFEADRQTINTNIRANWATFADGLADIAADTRIGDPGDSDDATYYADKVHLTAAGYAIIAGIVQPVVSAL